MYGFSALVRTDWIGQEVKVTNARNRSFFGIKGKVIDETKHFLFIRTPCKLVKVPKKGNVFELCLNNNKVQVKGDLIEVAPEERLKLKV